MLNNKRCGVFLEMGLGKTVCVLQVIQKLKQSGYKGKVLIITPASILRHVWQEENEKWGFNLTITTLYGTPITREKKLLSDSDIYLVSADNVNWLKDNHRYDFKVCVVDEFSLFRNTKSLRFKALKKLQQQINFERFIGLTGTPIVKNVYDLWGIMYLIDGGERLYKYRKHFQDEWFRPGISRGHIVFNWIPLKDAEEKILDKVKDITISMKSQDYLKLPDFINVDCKVSLDAKTMKKYKEFKKEKFLEFEKGVVDAKNAAILVFKLQQYASGCIYLEDKSTQFLHREKVKALQDIIAQSDSQVLVYSSYIHVTEMILKKVKDIHLFEKEKWDRKEVPAMVVNPKQAGYGLNLQTGGNVIVWFTPTYDLELYRQANARLYRQGQKLSVRCYNLVAANTIDESIVQVLASKGVNLDNLFEVLKKEKNYI
jgi:SNF2 family DNA or RNA helicase